VPTAPVRFTVSDGFRVNVAVTLLVASMVTAHGAVPLQPPHSTREKGVTGRGGAEGHQTAAREVVAADSTAGDACRVRGDRALPEPPFVTVRRLTMAGALQDVATHHPSVRVIHPMFSPRQSQ